MPAKITSWIKSSCLVFNFNNTRMMLDTRDKLCKKKSSQDTVLPSTYVICSTPLQVESLKLNDPIASGGKNTAFSLI